MKKTRSPFQKHHKAIYTYTQTRTDKPTVKHSVRMYKPSGRGRGWTLSISDGSLSCKPSANKTVQFLILKITMYCVFKVKWANELNSTISYRTMPYHAIPYHMPDDSARRFGRHRDGCDGPGIFVNQSATAFCQRFDIFKNKDRDYSSRYRVTAKNILYHTIPSPRGKDLVQDA